MTKKKTVLKLTGISTLFMVLFLSIIFLMDTGVKADIPEEGDGIETIDLSEYILQAGGLGEFTEDYSEDGLYNYYEEKYLSSGTSPVEEAILSGLLNKSGSIYLGAYNVNSSDVFSIYSKVINQHPELFYVVSRLSWSSMAGGYVTDIYPFYNSTYTDADIEIFNQKVGQIISGVDDSWTDIEKILYLHDYLVTNCEYDFSYSRYDAYNALVDGSSVCQGYALAFKCLMNSIGVEGDIVTSENLDHAWNLIELDEEYFYVDATWDDGGTGYCYHDNFMVDLDGIVAAGHDTTDWIGKISGMNVYSDVITSSRYNNFFWSDMTSAVPLLGTKAGYLSEGKVNVYDFTDNTVSSYDRVQEVWRLWDGYGYWGGDYTSIVACDGSFYYTTPQDIYRLDLDGTTTKVYTLSSDKAALGYIYGLTASGRNLTFILQTKPHGDITGNGTIRIYTKIDNFVSRMYQQCLSRDPDLAGLEGWVGQLELGYMDGAAIAEQFIFSQEMLNKNLSNDEFVSILYRAMMGREANETEKKGWIDQLNGGYMTRNEVAKSFVESNEFTRICTSYGITRGTYDASVAPIEHFVERFYKLCLERNPDQAGLYGWVGNLKNQYMNGAEIANAFIFSDEFVNKNISDEKYIELLYNTLLGRPSDAAGKQGWLGQLQGGYMTRTDMMKAFIESKEFTEICEAYGIIRGSL